MPNFTNLPAELRISVYEFYFEDIEHVSVGGIKYLAILRTSRLIAGEAAKIGRCVNTAAIKAKEQELRRREQEAALDAMQEEEGPDALEKTAAMHKRVWDSRKELKGLKKSLRVCERVQACNP